MGKQSIEIIKELLVSLLIVVCIVLIVSVILYDKISLSKVIPQSEEYALSDEMKEGLEDSKLNGAEEVIINYYIDATDLKKYEKNNEYIKGKSNPFAAWVSNNDVTEPDSNNTNTNVSNGFYEDEGTK